MNINLHAILDPLISYSMTLGRFDAVNAHEPKRKPSTSGITTAFWPQRVGPVPQASGLAATTGFALITQRLYTSMTREPQDDIDPAMLDAIDDLFNAYSGDLDLGGAVRNIDLLGQTGFSLSGQAGYANFSGTIFRVFDIMIPVIVNDVWAQA